MVKTYLLFGGHRDDLAVFFPLEQPLEQLHGAADDAVPQLEPVGNGLALVDALLDATAYEALTAEA